MVTRLASTGLWLACAVGIAGCSSETAGPRGQLMVAFTTDMAAGEGLDFDAVGVEVFRSGERLHAKSYTEVGEKGGPLTFPATLAIVAPEEPASAAEPVLIRLHSSRGAAPSLEPRTLREISVHVPSDRNALLFAHIEWLCLGSGELESDGSVASRCAPGETCVGGVCIPWDREVEVSELPTYEPGLVFGGGSESGDGDCLDVVPCFEGASVIALAEVRDTNCEIPKPEGGQGVNVAVVAQPGAGGICGPDACLVPLDKDTPSGWEDYGDRIELPEGVCHPEMWSESATSIVGVAVTSSCRTKTSAIPTCGPWSRIQTPLGTFDAGPPDLPPDGGE